MLNPIIKWSGGKSQEIKFFKKYYPSAFNRFIEPFVGGGAVFFDLNFEGENVINDIHKELVVFYEQIAKGNAIKIYELMKSFKNDEKDYYFIRDVFIPENDVETAFRFFYLRKTCFRGMLRYNKKGHFNIPFGRYKTYEFENILDDNYRKLLSNTNIMFGDSSKVFENYNSEENFVFLDPPYDSVFTDYGYCKYDKENHLLLFKDFSSTKNKCLMVIGETPFISNLYKDYIVDRFHKKYAFKIHSGRVGDEIDNYHLIIKNF